MTYCSFRVWVETETLFNGRIVLTPGENVFTVFVASFYDTRMALEALGARVIEAYDFGAEQPMALPTVGPLYAEADTSSGSLEDPALLSKA